MDAEIFKLNIRALLNARGLNQMELAEQCSLPYQWVRRVCSRGLTRLEDRNRSQLQALCDFFKVLPIERLWSPDLQAVQNEAAWYGSKVEAILGSTNSISDFADFEQIDEESLLELVKRIDQLNAALRTDRNKQLLRNTSLQEPKTARSNEATEQARIQNLSKARTIIEYSAKLGTFLKSLPDGFEDLSQRALQIIDAGYFNKQSRRVASHLREQYFQSFEAWAAHFDGENNLCFAIGASLSEFSEDDIILELTTYDPPTPEFDCEVFGLVSELMEWLRQPKVEADEGLANSTTFGGSVGQD